MGRSLLHPSSRKGFSILSKRRLYEVEWDVGSGLSSGLSVRLSVLVVTMIPKTVSCSVAPSSLFQSLSDLKAEYLWF